MSDPIIYTYDHYVVLEPSKDEKILTEKETLNWLESWLEKMQEIPEDLNEESSNKSSAKRLLDTACELEVKPGFKIQWFAVRLNPPER